MSGNTHKFVSMFRLEGKPILPPLMTSEKRSEMQKYRDQAIRLENHNKPCAELKTSSRTDVEDFCHKATDKAIQESYLLLTKLVLNDEDRNADIAARIKKLNKSETIIFDNITNAVIVPYATEEVNTGIPAINIDPPTPLARRSFAESIETNDYGSISESMPESLPMTPPKRSATSPALNQLSQLENTTDLSQHLEDSPQPTLIRSNSFTLKMPSPALIEHMRQQLQEQSKKSSYSTTPYVARDTIESKAKRQQKVIKKERTNMADIKNKRSPYEQRFDIKPKLQRNLKKTVNKKDASPCNSFNLQRKVKTVAADVNLLQQKTVFTNEAENTPRFLQLLAEQQEEQGRMLQVFELQRQQLLQELSCRNSPQATTKISPPSVNYSERLSASSNRKVKSNEHSRRKLFSDDYSSLSMCSTPLSSSATGKLCSFVFEQNKRVLSKN